MLGGRRVAGVGPLQDPAQPPARATYITVDDADETAARATEAGGHVAVAPMDVRTIYFVAPDADAIAAKAGELGGATLVEPFDAPGVGRIAILADPHRAVFGVISGDPPAE
jgi:predicted enzyme related to lactoylglutathione lyase